MSIIKFGYYQSPINKQKPIAGFVDTTKTKRNGVFQGIIIDSTNRQSVPFATVAVYNLSTGKLIEGAISDENGKFKIENIPVGSYRIAFNFIGYGKKEVSPIDITVKKSLVDFKNILLRPDTKQLGEVVVEGKKAVVEEKVDRIIYNAENDATTIGGDATDVMKRVPLLSVDTDGTVSLRGSTNIKVLINGRPSTISAGSIADALKQIPADQIKSVEVITSPSAKYDGEGSAGIINIILKKNLKEGGSLGIDASGGFRGSTLGLSGSYNKNKFHISLGGMGRANYNTPGKFYNTQTTHSNDSIQTENQQYATTRNNAINAKYNLGIDYDIDAHNFITSSLQYSARNNYTFQDQLHTQTFTNNSLTGNSFKNIENIDVNQTWDASLGYTHLFKDPKRELSFLGIYSINNRLNNFYTNLLDPNSLSTASRLKNINPSENREISFQLDYAHPINDKQTLEVGAKNTIRDVYSSYSYFSSSSSDGGYIQLTGTTLGNSFAYQQNIAAAYVAYSINFLKDYTLKAGLRNEYTTIESKYANGSPLNIPDYNVLLPSINISKKFENGNLFKIAFTRRIQRPQIQQLNPNLQASNPLSVTYGNPLLKPQFSNQAEVSYSMNFKKSFYTLAFFFRNQPNDIQQIRSLEGKDTVSSTYANIGVENDGGVNLFANFSFSEKLTVNGAADVFYRTISNNDPNPNFNAHNQGFVFRGQLTANYALPKDWGIQFFATYRGTNWQLQGYQTRFGTYSLILKKDLAKKRGSIGLGTENYFWPYIIVNTEVKSTIINQYTSTYMYNLNFKLTFSYLIGNKKSEEKKDKKGGMNIEE